MLPKLKQAGFNWLAFGIEAANSRVQADVDKRFDEEEVYETMARTKDAGINVIGNFIFGLPEDDHDSMRETLDLALDLNCEFANLYSTMAYPGSPLYTMAVAQNWALPETWSGYSQHSARPPLPTNHLTSAEVLAFRDRAFQKYFSSPGYLNMIGEKFGQETVEHIRQMTAYRLQRDLLDGTAEAESTLLPADDTEPVTSGNWAWIDSIGADPTSTRLKLRSLECCPSKKNRSKA